MSSKKEIRMAENYEITERISIGDRDVVFGMDMDNELPYFCSFLVDNGIYYFFPEAKAGVSAGLGKGKSKRNPAGKY